jgi:hypothetical protein
LRHHVWHHDIQHAVVIRLTCTFGVTVYTLQRVIMFCLFTECPETECRGVTQLNVKKIAPTV